MRISKIVIDKYRSFWEEKTIYFPDVWKPISIVWYNNAWKSNLVKAILIWAGRQYVWSVESICEDDFFEKRIEDNILIRTEIINSAWVSGTIKLESLLEEWKFQHIGDDAYPKIFARSLYNRRQEIALNSIYYFDFQQIDRANKIKTEWNYTILWREIKKFKDKFEADITRKSEFKCDVKSLVDTHMKDDDFLAFVSLVKNKLNEQLRIENQNVDIDFWIMDHNKIFNILSFYMAEADDKPLMPIESMGNWYRALFTIALLRAIAEDEVWHKVFILEEPETFLHEHYQEYFFGVLKQIAQSNQVILTTHSKKFVDIFSPETIIRLDKNLWHTEVKQNITWVTTHSVIEDNFSLSYPDEYWKRITTLEPNIWNILFAKKVIIVEWTHDVLCYNICLDREDVISNWLSFNNISIVASHGKSSSLILIQLCNYLQIPYYVIHDRDLENHIEIDFSQSMTEYTNNPVYNALSAPLKAQYTNNMKIFHLLSNKDNLHRNKPKIEESLNYTRTNTEDLTYSWKSSASVFDKLKWKSLTEIRREFPNLITQSLLDFLNDTVEPIDDDNEITLDDLF